MYKNKSFIKVYYIEFPIRIRGFPIETRDFWALLRPVTRHRPLAKGLGLGHGMT